MKKILTLTLCCFVSVTLCAQYKKAGFFDKEGRTYELGTNFSFLGLTESPAVSLLYSASLETSKKLSGFMDLELMLPSKFHYYAQYNVNGTPTSGMIAGQIPNVLLIKYGAQYRFINPEKAEETKLVPYARLGLLGGFIFSNNYKLKAANGDEIEQYNLSPTPPQEMSSFWGLEGGIGATYYFTEKFGLKVGGMYRRIFTVKSQVETGTFIPIDSHAGITVALKYRIFSE